MTVSSAAEGKVCKPCGLERSLDAFRGHAYTVDHQVFSCQRASARVAFLAVRRIAIRAATDAAFALPSGRWGPPNTSWSEGPRRRAPRRS